MSNAIESWSKVEDKSAVWVVFKNGTCVSIGKKAESDYIGEAIAIMKEFGPVHAGGPSGDFGVYPAKTPGWFVTSHHSNMNTYVGPDEVETSYPSGNGILSSIRRFFMSRKKRMEEEVNIGCYGRSKRNTDAIECQVVAVIDPEKPSHEKVKLV